MSDRLHFIIHRIPVHLLIHSVARPAVTLLRITAVDAKAYHDRSISMPQIMKTAVRDSLLFQ